MERTVFRNASLLDGDRPARPGTSLAMEGDRIREIAPDAAVGLRPGDRAVELDGRTLMPGMWSCHFHAAFSNWAPAAAPMLGLDAQPAMLTILAQANTKTAIDCGFTSLVCSSSAYNIDHALKQAIVRGIIEGPRIWACTREMTSPGDQADGRNSAWYMEIGNTGLVRHCSGPEAFREAIREELGRGADIAKIAASGGHGVGPAEEIESVNRAELVAAVEAAHGRGKKIRAHAASRSAILACARAGVDIIDHGDRMDDECIEAILEADATFAPTLLFSQRFLVLLQNMLDQGLTAGPSHLVETPAERQQRLDDGRADFENICRVLPEANRAGMRIVVGDDYGVVELPHGDYIDELELYVKLGIPPLDVIRWATRNGAEAVDRGDELGTLEVGKLADLLVVDGDPIRNITCLKQRDNLHAIVKGGVFYKDALGTWTPS
jgi:imidazolonepropionase-like amidohydrolase